MPKIKRLPDAELEIMNALWDADAPLTAAELETALPGPPRARTTLLTLLARLEEKGLLVREVIPHNRRQRALRITAAGEALLEELTPGLQRLRKRLLAPLDQDEQQQFMLLLDKLVQLNNPQSRAPLARLQEDRCDED